MSSMKRASQLLGEMTELRLRYKKYKIRLEYIFMPKIRKWSKNNKDILKGYRSQLER